MRDATAMRSPCSATKVLHSQREIKEVSVTFLLFFLSESFVVYSGEFGVYSIIIDGYDPLLSLEKKDSMMAHNVKLFSSFHLYALLLTMI